MRNHGECESVIGYVDFKEGTQDRPITCLLAGVCYNTSVPYLSIVIVNYNTMAVLRDCLASIREGEPSQTFEVFVVDNDSSDGSAGMVRREFPEVNLIQSGRNGGYAFANNIALRSILAARADQDAAHDYVMLLNPDTVIEADCISTMLDYMETHPHEWNVLVPGNVFTISIPDNQVN